MAELNLDEYLAKRGAEGTTQGEGNFTVSHSAAAQKLGKFALPRRYAWVSKLVQAATVWGCSELSVSRNHTQTRFRFPLAVEQVPAEETLLNTLLQVTLSGRTALQHFCQGLRALVQQTGLSFLLVLDNGQEQPRPIYAGAYFSNISEGQRLHPHYFGGEGITLTVDHIESEHLSRGMLSRFRGRMHGFPILGELNSRAYLSPVPIKLAQRRVDGLLNSAHAWRDNLRPLYQGGVVVPWLGLESLPVPESFVERTMNVFTDHRIPWTPEVESGSNFTAIFLVSVKIQARLGSFWEKQRPQGFLHWMVDGVVVQTEYLKVPTDILVLNVFLNGSGLKTDLSGFQLIDDIDKDYRRKQVEEAIGRFFEGTPMPLFFAPELPTAEPAPKRLRRRLSQVFKHSSPGLALSLFNPAFGVPVALGCGLVGAFSPIRDRRREEIVKYSGELQERLQADWQLLGHELQAEQGSS